MSMMKKNYQFIRKLSDSSQGRASVFGRNVPDILRAMKSARFKGEVIGPLGIHIKITVSGVGKE